MDGNLKPITVTVVESLLAKSVVYSDIIPDSLPELSYDMAIAQGSLIGSNTSPVDYVPFLSPVAYSNYIKDNLHSKDPFAALLAEYLQNIIGVQSFFSYQGFEMIAYTREVLMSVIRNKIESSPETVRSLLRGIGLYSLRSDLLDVTLESSTCFEIKKFMQVRDYVFCNKSDIYVPENGRNPGFDFFIRFPTADKSYLNVVYEMKYSDPTSIKPANLNKSLIVDKHNKCKEIFGDDFVFVVFGWRETTTSLSPSDLPPNIVVLDKFQLSKLYGPSLAEFIDIQMTEEPQMILMPGFKEINKLSVQSKPSAV